jgi:hypothetical protein
VRGDHDEVREALGKHGRQSEVSVDPAAGRIGPIDGTCLWSAAASTVMQGDVTTTELKKVVHEVRWMSPDPNDRSVETVPEPD